MNKQIYIKIPSINCINNIWYILYKLNTFIENTPNNNILDNNVLEIIEEYRDTLYDNVEYSNDSFIEFTKYNLFKPCRIVSYISENTSIIEDDIVITTYYEFIQFLLLIKFNSVIDIYVEHSIIMRINNFNINYYILNMINNIDFNELKSLSHTNLLLPKIEKSYKYILSLKNSNDELGAEIAYIKYAIKSDRTKIKDIYSSLISNQSDIDILKSTNSIQTIHVDNLDNKINDNIDNINDNIDNINENITSQQIEINILKSTNYIQLKKLNNLIYDFNNLRTVTIVLFIYIVMYI